MSAIRRPVRLIAPAMTPVSLAEVKARLRIDHAEDDADLTAMIATAVAVLDGWSGLLGRCLINQTWRSSVSGFAFKRCLPLPFDPIYSVVSVKYIDPAGVEQVLDPSFWHHVEASPEVIINSGAGLPATAPRSDAVRVTFVAGYGPTPEDVPAPLRHSILTMVADYYAARESFARGSISQVPAMMPPRALMVAYARRFVSFT